MRPRREPAAEAAQRERFISLYRRATTAGLFAGGAVMLISLIAYAMIEQRGPSLLMGLAALCLPVFGAFAGDAWARRQISLRCDTCGARLQLQRDPGSTRDDVRYQFWCPECRTVVPAEQPGGPAGGGRPKTPALSGVNSADELPEPVEHLRIPAQSGLTREHADAIGRIARRGASLHLTIETPPGMDRELQDLTMLELNQLIEDSRLAADRVYVEAAAA